MDMLRIGVIGVTGTLLAIQFKNEKSEYGMYISAVLSLVIFLSILGYLETLTDAMKSIGRYIRMDQEYIGTLIKMLGITYIAEFSSGICKDAKYLAIASQLEIFGKLAVLALSMPILMALLNTVRNFLS